jgi:transcriptional regulator with XRE-family HTH domain
MRWIVFSGDKTAPDTGRIDPTSRSYATRCRLRAMPTRESRSDRGRATGVRARTRVASELRDARRSAGLSQSAVGEAAGMSHGQVSRIERARLDHVTLDQLARLANAVGLDLVVRTYPAGDPVRDAAQLGLLGRLRERIATTWRWRTEVPLPIPGDRRAWDAVIADARTRIGVEAETVIDDAQSLQRRIALKRRDGEVDQVVLLVARTARNRRALLAAGPGMREAFPVQARSMLAALAQGSDPGGSGIVML